MAVQIPVLPDTNEEKITTVIAEDLEIRGTIRFDTSVMLKGIFEGEIQSQGLLVVGEGAKVTATIVTKTLVSNGVIVGNVKASEQIILKNTAVHTGDLHAPFITIESGAAFNGSAAMDRTQYKMEHRSTEQESDILKDTAVDESPVAEDDMQIRLVSAAP